MANPKSSLLSEIEAFLAETGMGESYFGKRAVGNSELVSRLRKNGRVWPETAERARDFMKENHVRSSGHMDDPSAVQGDSAA